MLPSFLLPDTELPVTPMTEVVFKKPLTAAYAVSGRMCAVRIEPGHICDVAGSYIAVKVNDHSYSGRMYISADGLLKDGVIDYNKILIKDI